MIGRSANFFVVKSSHRSVTGIERSKHADQIWGILEEQTAPSALSVGFRVGCIDIACGFAARAANRKRHAHSLCDPT